MIAVKCSISNIPRFEIVNVFPCISSRFNLRSSNTEPLIRLNVEARGSVTLMQAKTEELLAVLKSQGAVAADA